MGGLNFGPQTNEAGSFAILDHTLEQLSANLQALDISFAGETLQRLEAIWPGPGGEAPNAYAW